MEQIQILPVVLRFNLSPRPRRWGTAPSSLSLAIGLLPLTSPKVLSPSARIRHGHTCPFYLLRLLQLQNNLKPQRIRVRNSVFVITSTGAHFTCALICPGTYLIWRGIWRQSWVSETRFRMFNLESLLIRFYACLKFQRKGIDYVAVSELGTWTDCTWVIMKEGNPFQTENSCSQIRS